MNTAEWLLKDFENYCKTALSNGDNDGYEDVLKTIAGDIDKYFDECKIAERGTTLR